MATVRTEIVIDEGVELLFYSPDHRPGIRQRKAHIPTNDGLPECRKSSNNPDDFTIRRAGNISTLRPCLTCFQLTHQDSYSGETCPFCESENIKLPDHLPDCIEAPSEVDEHA